jgi:Family of unknown function (DUF6502)
MPSVRSFESSRVNGLNQETARASAILRELLVELALTLVPRGVTPRTFSDLSKHAFALAAASLSQRPNGKINYSRVAALTGLSRADVKRLLQTTNSTMPLNRSGQMPIDRVLNGWCTDRRFVDKKGNPRPLRVSGPLVSFARLTRLYGGDVPHRAVLEELRRVGAVRTVGENVVLTIAKARRGRPSIATLSSVLPAIIDGIRMASDTHVAPAIYRLTIPAKSSLDLAIMRERCSSTITTMLSGLGDSLGGNLTTPKNRQLQQHSFVVTVLLSENKGQEPVQRPMRSDVVRGGRTVKRISGVPVKGG